MAKLKRNQSEVKAKSVSAEPVAKKRGRPPKVIAVTRQRPEHIEPVVVKTSKLVKTCADQRHDCLAIQLTNRLITMILEFEINMKRIQDHPSLSDDTKSDISNYINKNIISALWALSPAFDLMVNYPRTKAFKSIYLKAFKRGVPGILQEVKHI